MNATTGKWLVAIAACVSFAAHAQLQGRDLNGDGAADAFYDVQQDITWLGDANYYVTQGNPLSRNPYYVGAGDAEFLPEGQIRLRDGPEWASSLNFNGVTGWRLPTRLVPANRAEALASGVPFDSHWCNATSCGSFIGSPWRSELSNLYATLNGSSGPFVNLLGGFYLTSAWDSPVGSWDELFDLGTGRRILSDETGLIFGHMLAVHNGDVGVPAVPEPSSYALALLGLGVVAFAKRRRRE